MPDVYIRKVTVSVEHHAVVYQNRHAVGRFRSLIVQSVGRVPAHLHVVAHPVHPLKIGFSALDLSSPVSGYREIGVRSHFRSGETESLVKRGTHVETTMRHLRNGRDGCLLHHSLTSRKHL